MAEYVDVQAIFESTDSDLEEDMFCLGDTLDYSDLDVQVCLFIIDVRMSGFGSQQLTAVVVKIHLPSPQHILKSSQLHTEYTIEYFE